MQTMDLTKTLRGLGVLGVCLLAPCAFAHPGDGLLSLDADGDGKVSFEEFRPQEREGREGRRGRFLDRADLDGDGAVSRDEMLESISAISEERSQQALQRFDETDVDGNGVVSQEEARTKRFARLDQDGDGFLTEAEAQAAHEKRRRGRRHGERNS